MIKKEKSERISKRPETGANIATNFGCPWKEDSGGAPIRKMEGGRRRAQFDDRKRCLKRVPYPVANEEE